MKLQSIISVHADTYENIPLIADGLIDRLHKNKLLKADRDLLQELVSLVYEIRVNQQ